jgi:transposase-like protein
MNQNRPLCIKFGVSHQCPICKSENLIKSGITTNGKQRYCCKKCNKRFIVNYCYNAYQSDTNKQIILFTKEGLGIRSTARVLKISVTTLLKRIISIAKNIEQPPIEKGKKFIIHLSTVPIILKGTICR